MKIKITECPPDSRLADWPYAPESDVPECLRWCRTSYEYNRMNIDSAIIRNNKAVLQTEVALQAWRDSIMKLHGYAVYLPVGSKGEKHGKAKLTDRQVIKIRSLYKRGISCKELAANFNMSTSQIYAIVTKQSRIL